MAMNEKRYAKMKMSESMKENDVENIKRLTEQCINIGADNVFRMLSIDNYAWSGKFVGEDIDEEVLYNSVIESGVFKNCIVRDCNIQGGFFENCVILRGSIEGSPTIKDSTIDGSNIFTIAKPTLISTKVTNEINKSFDVTTIDMEKLDVKVVK